MDFSSFTDSVEKFIFTGVGIEICQLSVPFGTMLAILATPMRNFDPFAIIVGMSFFKAVRRI